MKKIYLVILLGLLIGPMMGWGQIYVNVFTGVLACPTNGNTPAVATNATGTPLSRSTVTCNATANVFNSSTLNVTASVSNSSYIEFSATANVGYILNLTSVSFFRQGSASAPNQMEVRYSTDGFLTSTSWGAAPTTPTTGTVATWDFTDFSSVANGTIVFRIYPYGTTRCDLTAPAPLTTGTFRVDDVTINGTVSLACTAQTITAISPASITKVYGDAPYSVATTANSGLSVTYSSSNTGVATVDASGNVTVAAPGTATITAAQAGNTTYCAATSVTQALTVNTKILTISGLTANSKVFDGNTTATLSGTPTLVGLVGGDVITIGGTPVANFNDASVATGKPVTVSGYTISGTNAARYTLTQPTGLTADITNPATPTITASGSLTSVSTTYGTPSGNTSFSVSGLSMSAGITITPPIGFQVSTFADFSSNVGTNSTPITIGGAGTIASTIIYVRLAATAAVIGTYNSQNIVLSSSGATTVNVSTTASGNTVIAKALTITGLSGVNKTYDATVAASFTGTAAYNGLVNGETFGTVTGTPTASFANKTVGVGKTVTITGYTAPSSNYTITNPTVTATIFVANLTVSGATATNKAYDRTMAATTSGGSFNGVISGDVVTLTHGAGTFAQANVGTGIGVTANITATNTDGANYAVTQPTGLTANIIAKALTISSPTASNKVFDNTTTATLGGTLSGVISPDVVTLTLSGTFATAAIGNGIAVTSTSTLSGADAGNYTLTQPTGLTANITPNATSDIAFNFASGTSDNANIAYINYQGTTLTSTSTGANGSVGVMGFFVRDGGSSLTDADNLSTDVTAITFSVTNSANIRFARLFDGASPLGTPIAVSGGNLVFTGLTGITAADGTQKAFNLRVTFNSTVTDNQQMVFTITSVTANSTGSSTFALANGGGAFSATSGDINRIEVTADRLAYTQQPSNVSINANMTPAVKVAGVDVNTNVDLDYTGTISITSTGTLTVSPVSVAAVSGVATFSTLTHTVAQTGRVLTGTTTGLTISNMIGSNTFDITNEPANSYRTIANGNWHSTTASGSTNTWQQLVSGTWTNISNSPPANTSNNVYIRNLITLVGTNSASNIIIESGGTLSTSTVGPTFTNLLVKDGGRFNKEGNGLAFNAGGILEVEDNGTFTYRHTNTTARSTNLWAGIEKFHENSNFIVLATDAGSGFLITENVAAISLYNGALFGNFIVDMDGGQLPLFPATFNTVLTNGDLIFRKGTDNAKFFDGSYTATIRGDLIIESTYTQRVTLLSGAGPAVLNVEGDIKHEGTQPLSLNTGTGTSTVNLKGDLMVSSVSSLNATSTLSAFNFSGIGNGLTPATTQTIDIATVSTSTENNFIAFAVKSGAYVQQITRDFELGTNSGIVVESGATFDFGFNGTTALVTKISGSQTGTYFTSQTGSTLKITSPDGITTTSGLGNVQVVAGNRSYIQTGNFWYIGKANQVTGNGLTIGSTIKNVFVNLLDNTTELRLTNRIGIADGGKLEIQKGILIGAEVGVNDNDFYGTGQLAMTDGEYRISTITANPATDFLPQLSKYLSYSLTGGKVTLNGNNAIQTLSGTPSYYNLKFDGANTLGAVTSAPYATDYKTISNATTVWNSIELAGTSIVSINNTLGGTTTAFTMNGTSRYITGGGGTKPDAGGAYSLAAGGTIELYGSAASEVRLNASGANPVYSNLIIRGTNVSTSSAGAGINFLAGGSFTVKTGGKFIVNTTDGFSNSANLGSTAISNVAPSNPAITLEPNSTIEYGASGNQTITNAAIASPSTGNYVNLSIAGTGTKTAPSGTLAVQGNLTKSGTSNFAHNKGLVLLNGTSTNQTFAGLTYYGLQLSNGGTKFTNGNDTIIDVIQLDDNTKLDIKIADSIVLRSTSIKTARVGIIGTGATIEYNDDVAGVPRGRFIVERHIKAGRRWRYLSIPTNDVNQTFKSAWQEGATVAGNQPGGNPKSGYGFNIGDVVAPSAINGFDISALNGASIKTYTPIGNTYLGIPISTGTNTKVSDIVADRGNHLGYMTFVPGDRSVISFTQSGSTTLRSSGKLHSGPQPVTIPINAAPANFRGVGNPYASPINMIAVLNPAASPGNFLAPAYYVYDPNAALLGAFITMIWDGPPNNNYIVSSPGSAAFPVGSIQNNLESGAGFFVLSTNTGVPTLNFSESVKIPAATSYNFTAGEPQYIYANISRVDALGNAKLMDGMMASFDVNNSNDANDLDILKMTNTNETVSFITSGKKFAYERRAEIVDNDTLHIHMASLVASNYKWEIISNNLDFPGRTGFLIDRYLGTTTPLNMAGTTTLNFSIQNIPASYAADRFKIVFNQAAAGPLPVTFTTVTANRNADKSVAVQWKVEQEINIVGYELERSNNGSNFTPVHNRTATGNNSSSITYDHTDLTPYNGDNFYRIKATSVGGQIQYSNIVKLSGINSAPIISVYPNPVVDRTMQIRFQNQESGKYQVQLLNVKGQLLFSKTLSVISTTQAENVQLPSSVAAGTYQLQVRAANGNITQQTIVIQ